MNGVKLCCCEKIRLKYEFLMSCQMKINFSDFFLSMKERIFWDGRWLMSKTFQRIGTSNASALL